MTNILPVDFGKTKDQTNREKVIYNYESLYFITYCNGCDSMVQAVITFSEHDNRIVNIVKAKYGYKNKSKALEHIIRDYELEHMEPDLRPEYIEKLKRIETQKRIKVKDFDKHFGLE